MATDLKSKSVEIIVKNQHPSGSYVACPNFDTYKYCWLRDGSFIAHSMDLTGNTDSSGRFFDWVDMVISRQSEKVKKIINMADNCEPLSNNDYLPTRYRLDGEETQDDWPNFQLDGYGTWLWALCTHIDITGKTELLDKYSISIKTSIDYLLKFWSIPNFDCWEENGDKVHPSTLACIYGGLDSIGKYIKDGDIQATLYNIKQYVNKNCMNDGRLAKYAGSQSIDASLLWTTIPFGMFNPSDSVILKTVDEIEKRLLHRGVQGGVSGEVPSGVSGGVHRYPEDTYYGGGEWLLLSCWLGWYYVEAGKHSKADEILRWVEAQANEKGEMPEQVIEHVNDRGYIDKWIKMWGEPANPLLWSHAMYLILRNKMDTSK